VRTLNSGKKATNRLKNIISEDRSVLSVGSIRVLKKEIGNILSKYLEIDKRKIKIQVEQTDNESYNLSADLPMKQSIKEEDK
jgi:cell division topological specificity factor MinE